MTDVFTNRGGLSEKSTDKAQRAVKAFRKLQPTLSSYARVLTGDSKVRVEMSTSNGMTDGKKIYFRPPLALGDDTPHDRGLCDKRDDNGVMLCPACDVREQVLIVIYHEIGHIAFGSFEETPENKEKYLREVLASLADTYDVARRGQHVKVHTTDATKSYLGLAQYVSKFLPIVVNALEDSRVNNSVMEARRGTRVMFEADTYRVMQKGVEQVDPDTGETIVVHHRDYPLNMQVAIGLYLKALGISAKGYLRDDVAEALVDKKLTAIVNKMSTARSASATFEIGIEALFRLQQLGYFDPPEDMEQDEPDPEESEEESDDNGEGQGDDGDPGDSDEAPQESDEQGSEEGDPGDDSTADDEERSPDGGEAGGSDGEDSPDQDGTPGEADQEEGEHSDDASDSDSPDNSEGDSEEGESDGGAGDDSDVREAEEDSGDGGGSDDREGSEDASVQDDEPESGSEGSAGEGEVDDSESDPAEGSQDSEGADGGSPEPHAGEDADASDELESEASHEGGTEGSEAQSSDNDLASADLGSESQDGTPSDQRDVDDGASDTGVPDGGDGSDLAPEESASSDEDRNLDHDDGGPESDTDSGVREDDSADIEPVDSGADEGRGGVELKENSAYDDLPMGDPEEVEKALHEIAHPEERPNTLEEGEGSQDEKEMDRAIIQGLYFESPSRNVHGVREHYYGQPHVVEGYNMSEGWPKMGQSYDSWYTYAGVDGDFEAPESILGPALLRMRVAFADNKRGHELRHRKAGKVDASVLGKRAHFGDSRLFKRRVLPGKKDYFVLIGIDISGSTVGVNLQLSKRAALAQAELCARMGIKFAVYAHTGNYHSPSGGRQEGLDMEIYHVKDPDEPWSTAVKERLTGLGPSSVNLDGHTIEFYRKILDGRPETHKIMLYYTDGKMPAENHDEELEILQREIKICRRKKHLLLGVGIRTDSPVRHGLDTVQVDDDEDIVKVVKHLERRLLEL